MTVNGEGRSHPLRDAVLRCAGLRVLGLAEGVIQVDGSSIQSCWEPRGRFRALLVSAQKSPQRRALRALKVVAGAGFEPTTSRL